MFDQTVRQLKGGRRGWVGISPSPGWEWLALGEGKEPRGRKISNRFVEFVEAVRKVEADLKLALKKKGANPPCTDDPPLGERIPIQKKPLTPLTR